MTPADHLDGLRALVLDPGAWTVLLERAGVQAPEGFTTGPAAGPATGWGEPDGAGPAGQAAAARLQAAGLLDDAGRVQPGMGAALAVLGSAPVRARVRSWTGDRMVLGELAVTASSGVGLARLRRVDPAGGADGQGQGQGMDGLGVQVSVFPPSLTVAAIHRLLPPAVTENRQPGPREQVHLPWPDLVALGLATEAHQHTSGPDHTGNAAGPGPAASGLAGQVAAEAVRLLARSADGPGRGQGSKEMPALLDELLTRLDGSVEITLRATPVPPSPGSPAPVGALRTWAGTWLLTGDRLVSVNAHAAPGAAAGADPGPGAVVDLADTDGPTLRQDLTAAVAGALSWACPPTSTARPPDSTDPGPDRGDSDG